MADNDKQRERLQTILTAFDRDWVAGDEARREATNDLFFSRVSHWDDWLNQYTTLQYRGQFDVVRPVVRKLVAEMRQNPIEVLFKPKDTADPDAADTLMGMYRTDMRHNTAKISVNVAVREQIECGVGAWRLVTEHEDQDPTSNNQIIRRIPIHGATSHVIWDSNAKQMDKSDAKHVMVINALSVGGWEAFAKEYGFDADTLPDFRNPSSDWVFPWLTKDVVYVGEYYEVEEKKEKVFIYLDPMTGEPVSYYQRDIKDVIDELADRGMQKVAERNVSRRRVYKSIVTSSAILKSRELIAGEHLPIVPVFGEWGFVDDKEVFEGVVRLCKDAQRLRNFILSAGADTVAKSPTKKPFFWAEQIAGYEQMYENDTDYPYYLLNRTDENGQDIPPQPLSYMENPELAQANVMMLQAATDAVQQVNNVGVDPDAVNGNQVAFDTVNQLNMRSDLQTYVFQDNLATAMRRDGEIYAAMVNDIYDVPRNVTVTQPDGSEKEVQTLSQVVDYRTGQVVTLNDIRGRYETYTDVGPSFQSMKEQRRGEIKELLAEVDPSQPVYNVLLLQYLTLLDGKGTEITRDYANKQLVIQGLKKPETQEEEQWAQQAQQQQQSQPDPNLIAAQAQMALAQAEQQKAQNEAMRIQNDARRFQNEVAQTQVKAFTAQQQAQESQANTVLKLAQAQDIKDGALMDGVRLLHEVSTEQQKHLPGIPAGRD
ncbi:portal protein [Serratia marcescens]|uniref:Portal protein n=1 Tax=Serratia marcescens TaxID=615 RepID=A0A9X8VDA1_SERMA|nr:portal protein [Serratia marcescens]MBS3894724.1 portal protein [Serratia marcescens]